MERFFAILFFITMLAKWHFRYCDGFQSFPFNTEGTTIYLTKGNFPLSEGRGIDCLSNRLMERREVRGLKSPPPWMLFTDLILQSRVELFFENILDTCHVWYGTPNPKIIFDLLLFHLAQGLREPETIFPACNSKISKNKFCISYFQPETKCLA